VNSILGSGSFGLPSVLAARLGGLSPFSCLLAGAWILIVAACIAEVSSRFDVTGGLYLYARDAFGQFTGLLVAWLTWLTRIAAPAANANLFCAYAAQFFPALGGRVAVVAVLAVLIGQLALFNYVGVKTGNNVSNAFTGIKVSFLVFFVVSGLVALFFHPSLRVPQTFATVPLKSWSEAILLLVFAYGGFEGALFVGGETQNPRRDTPIALLVALAVVCVIYTAVQYVVVAVLPNPAESIRPLTDAMQRFLGPAGAVAIGLAALVATYGNLSANLLTGPRITFALSEQGDFPKILSAVHPRFRTPYVSILLYAGVLFAFAAFGNFRWNAMLSAVSRLAVFGLMALAVPVLRRRDPAAARFRLPVPYLFAGAGIIFSIILLTRMGRGEFIIIGVTCGVALLNWLLVRHR